MGYTIDIVNNSDNKSFVITRTIDNTDIPSGTTFQFLFCRFNSTPLSYVQSDKITFTPDGLKVASMTVPIASIKVSGANMFGSELIFPDGIAAVVMDTTLAGQTVSVTQKKLFSMNCREIIYRNACAISIDDVLKSERRYTENLINAYIKMKGMNSSAVTGLEDQLMINLEELQRLCQTLQ